MFVQQPSGVVIPGRPRSSHARIEASFLAGGAFAFPLMGLLFIAAAFPGAGWAWVLWIVSGVMTGAVVARPSSAPLAALSVPTFYAIGWAVGLISDTGPFWVLGALIGAGLVPAGFLVGTAIALRREPIGALKGWWRRLARVAQTSLVGTVVVALLALTGYIGYVGNAAAGMLSQPTKQWADAATPMSTYGWFYEAVNYNKADDTRIASENPSMQDVDLPPSAGSEVVSPDGVPLAGFYIPAADGAGPMAPTLVVVPGWTSSKSETLKYAPVFHEHFNLLHIDLRAQGRSGEALVTFGLREQTDLRAMIDWLVTAKQPRWIGLLGNSMGGITALAEATADPRVEAVILDSTQATFLSAFGNGLEQENGQPAVPGAWAGTIAYSWRVGGDVTSVDPLRTVTRMGDRPVLLLYGTADVLATPAEAAEPIFHAGLAAGVPVELHYMAGAEHGRLLEQSPADFARWTQSFLAGALERSGQ